MIYDKADKVNEEFFESLLTRYQIGLETSMTYSDFVFDCVHLFYNKCCAINPKCGGSYIVFPESINPKRKNKSNQ